MISQNKSLWHLVNEYESLVSQLYDPETGEVNEIVKAQLDNIEPDIEKKCLGRAYYLKKMESEEKELDRFIEELTKRRQKYHDEIEKRMTDLKSEMERCNITQIKCPYFTLKIRKNPYGTDVYDERLIPSQYWITRQIVKDDTRVDREAIKRNVLESGVQVPGANVMQKTTLKISIEKL